jgi:hypothetical protein
VTYSVHLSGVRLPNKLIAEIDAFAKSRGLSRSEAVRRLIAAGLGRASRLREPRKTEPPPAPARPEAPAWVQEAARRAEERGRKR